MKQQVQLLRNEAAIVDRPDVKTLRLTGSDRVRYLNGMVSWDVTKLTPGTGHPAVKPNNKGRVEGVLRVRVDEDEIRLDLSEAVASKVQEVLEKFIIMDDCVLDDVSSTREVIGVYGPKAREALGNLDPGELLPQHFVVVGDVAVIRDPSFGVDGYELHAPAGAGGAVKAGLTANEVPFEALNVLRIEAGVPLDGIDIDDDTIPMEARLEPAIDFQKGCYIGQEVISRATNLGGIKHILVGFDVGGEAVPPAGAKVLTGGKQTGEVTSATRSPTLDDRIIAIGYVRKTDEFVGNPVTFEHEGETWEATIAQLPFVS